MLFLISFGTVVPVLLLLAPVVSLLNMRALQWTAKYSGHKSFAELLVERVLVQLPIRYFGKIGLIVNVLLSTFLFVDLQFETGPIVLYVTGVVIRECILWWLNQRFAPVSSFTLLHNTPKIGNTTYSFSAIFQQVV